jgi:hypothetical protein
MKRLFVSRVISSTSVAELYRVSEPVPSILSKLDKERDNPKFIVRKDALKTSGWVSNRCTMRQTNLSSKKFNTWILVN